MIYSDWCSSPVLGYLTNVTAIETEGVVDGNTDAWVERYYLSTSNSSDQDSFVNYTEGGELKIVSLFGWIEI